MGLFDQHMLEKRQYLLDRGIDPYPYRYDVTHQVARIRADEAALSGQDVSVAGRVLSIRQQGRVAFLDLRDATGAIQLMVAGERTDGDTQALVPSLSPGDLVGCIGRIFRTRRGELTLAARHLEMLAKVLIPLPLGKTASGKEFSRLNDLETRHRHRHLEWIVRPESRETLHRRARILAAIRRVMDGLGFLEVTTPTIELTYGGAEARPFVTSVHALGNETAYLRISPELHLKRLVVGGFEKVYTICQNFRNEGIDRSHNPEFTMMEWYEVGTDYVDQMRRFEELVATVAEEVCGTTRIQYQGVPLDLTPPWRRLPMGEAVSEATGCAVDTASAETLRALLGACGVPLSDPFTWGQAVATLFDAACAHMLSQPVFVMDHPIEVSPLAKRKRGNRRLAERFEPYIAGMEIGNAYSELTDPVEQYDRFLDQQRTAGSGSLPEHPLDLDFVRALACGMPPTGGVGLGIDRLIMLLCDAPSIRDVIAFPLRARAADQEGIRQVDQLLRPGSGVWARDPR